MVRKEEPEKRVANMGSEKQSGRGSDAAGLPECPTRFRFSPQPPHSFPVSLCCPRVVIVVNAAFHSLTFLGSFQSLLE